MSQQSARSGLWSHHYHGIGVGGGDWSIPTTAAAGEEQQQHKHHSAGAAVAASTEEAWWSQQQQQQQHHPQQQPESSSSWMTTQHEEEDTSWAAHPEEQGGQPQPHSHHHHHDDNDDDDESPATNIVSVNRSSSDDDDDGGDDEPPEMVVAAVQEEQQEHPDDLTVETVLHRIESLATTVVDALDAGQMPELVPYQRPFSHEAMTSNKSMTKRMTLQQCRSFTSVLLVLAYCHSLLLQSSQSSGDGRKTTTIREVYYFYVTHFRSQRECDAAIWDACQLLRVPRHALGLQAGSRGWFCGDVRLMRHHPEKDENNEEVLWDGRAHAGEQGCPIAADWLLPPHQRSFYVAPHSNITCILVVEKEGIYQRLVQDEFWRQHHCILVTGKGFPDLATRACVHALHRQLRVPVRGLADCDPFGVLVLHCYAHGSDRDGGSGGNGSGYRVPMEWIGLRPSQVRHLSAPATVTENDSQQPEQPPPPPPKLVRPCRPPSFRNSPCSIASA